MSEEKKKDIGETLNLIKGLDRQSLLIIQAGAQMLKARRDMDADKEAEGCTPASDRKWD